MFTAEELLPVKLTLELALITTVFLLLVATPLAWWLSHTKSKWRAPISSIVTLPLVLPPSVLGFYLLVAMGPSGPLGKLTEALGIGLLTFTFPGLVIGSIVYSMPFAVQPLQAAFESIGKRPLEVAATVGAKPMDAFFNVVLPLAKPGFVTAVSFDVCAYDRRIRCCFNDRRQRSRKNTGGLRRKFTAMSKQWNTVKHTGLPAEWLSLVSLCCWD